MKDKTGHINVSVANCYGESTYKSEIVTQGILGEKVEMLDRSGDFVRIRQADHYESWISKHQLSEGFTETDKSIVVRNHFLRIYSENSVSSLAVKDAVIGTRLKVIQDTGSWYQLGLPGGETGWVEKKGFRPFPVLSKHAVAHLSQEFAGYQYSWGGKTPKGMDCSGFTQLVYFLLGKILPRDSWMQKEEGPFLSDDFHDADVSDLLFFGPDKNKATHVGISLGKGRVIHSRGWVRLDSMIEGNPGFNPDLVHQFISVNRYIS